MTTTSHALTGAMIATVVKQPYLAIPLAFASHFLCDALPHFGINMKFGSKAMYVWLILDCLAAMSFAVFLIVMGVNNPALLAVSGFAAMSPDLAWLYYGLKGKLEDTKNLDIISKIHSKIQWYQKPPGILVDAVWIVLMVTIILKLQ
jgi:hypothetical protein